MASVTCITAANAPAFAADVVISTRAYDLASIESRAALDRQVVRAAGRLCRTNGLRPLADFAGTRRCAAEAVTDARAQLAR